jgi:hypothetical protein
MHHDDGAPIHAAMRAEAMLEAGDLDCYAVWKRILRAVEELQRVEGGAWSTGALSLILATGLYCDVVRHRSARS